MFSKILIANRGEIACRIIRTCRRMGIATVAIYSEADAGALHVRMADEAVFVGPSPAIESYLNIPAVIEAARKTGAQAIHPGYGFLSQNATFARACHDNGITFIGPSPQVMERMADKLLGRDLASQAGLPVLRGTPAELKRSTAVAHARALGFPLMVKAANGGGGIGIQIVHNPDDLKRAMDLASRVAQKAFGSSKLYLEQYLERASHLEVQVVGDNYGNIIHMYERDCSVQRRNQKVVEEAPSAKLTPEQRERLTGYALALARYLGYTNVGTIEFLVSESGEAFFLEMNTRLQVEHGVTEMVTGVDMVELQIRIAAGEPLPLRQEDVKLNGHAMEVRVYSEDPQTFLPCTGKVEVLREPSREHVRVDSCLFPGLEITPFYDPMLAKVMAWGRNRDEARKRLLSALSAYWLEGVVTNLPLLSATLEHPDFASGNYNTRFLSEVVLLLWEQSQMGAFSKNSASDREMAAAIAVALLMARSQTATPPGYASINRTPSPWLTEGRLQQMAARTMAQRGWR